MRKRGKTTVAVLAATVLFSVAVSNASANHLSITEKNFEMIWNAAQGASKTDLSWIDSAGHTVTCKVTLLGSFNTNTIAKTTGVNIGGINHATIGTCAAGSGTILLETLPWSIRYASFSGTLPNGISAITINVLGVGVRLESGGGLSCLILTEAAHPLVLIFEAFSGGATENVRADETRTIESRSMFCFTSPFRFAGKGLNRNLPGVSRLTVTLI